MLTEVLLLLVMAGVSLFTGARASPPPYKLCPPIFSSAAGHGPYIDDSRECGRLSRQFLMLAERD